MSKENIDYRLETVKMVEKLHKTIYNQDQKIADLEAKLAEKDEQIERRIAVYEKQFIEQTNENYELKQQLAEKDKAIENWETMYKGVVQTCHNDKEEIKKLKKQNNDYADSLTKVLNENADLVFKLAEKEKEIESLTTDLQKALALIKEGREIVDLNNKALDRTKQDKISFAVEQLEKVKEFFLKEERNEEMDTDYVITKENWEIADFLLDQIKQLKEGE